MNKKGFISISIIYSFLLVFIAVVFSILAMYTSRRLNMMEIQKDVKNLIDSKSNFDCLSSGITNLGECIIHKYGGELVIKNQPSPNFSVATTEGEYGLYSTLDDYGDSYYFRGAVPDNYVRFGKNEEGVDMYWRIIRINGNGTIRLIYAGDGNNDSTIDSDKYTLESGDWKYVGFTYDLDGTETDSTIKGVLDEWYTKNLEADYNEYLADSIYCNDRNISDTSGMMDIYDAFDRVENASPVLTCTNKSDRYTVDDTEVGNGLLSKPIGLLTVDEIIFAGGTGDVDNTNFYLYNNSNYWSISPESGEPQGVFIYMLSSNGRIESGEGAAEYNGIRPVINLVSNIEIKSGKGTVASPYILKEVN